MPESRYPLHERLGSLLSEPVLFKSGVFGRPIKETHGSVATHVAARHGVVAVANGFRCPPNREHGGTFTDAMGTTCGLFIAAEAIGDALEAVGEAANGVLHSQGKEGGKAEAVRAKNREILGAIEEAGGRAFDPTPEFVDSVFEKSQHSIFGVRTVEEVAEDQKTKAKRFLGHVRTYLTTGEEPKMNSGWYKAHVDALHPDVKELIKSSTDEELIDIMRDQAVQFHQGVSKNIRVSIPSGTRLDAFISEGQYRTTHEVGSDHSDSHIRGQYERQIGFPMELDPAFRPASGYVMHPEWEQRAREEFAARVGREPTEFDELRREVAGSVGSYGNVDLILRPEVAERSAFGSGDSISTMLRPARFDETDPDRIFAAIVSAGGKETDTIDQTLGLLESHRTGSFRNLNVSRGSGATDWKDMHPDAGGFSDDVNSRRYFETLIAGSFGVEDVAAVRIGWQQLSAEVVPLDYKENARHWLEKTKKIRDEFFTADALKKMGFTEEEIDYIMGLLDNYKPMSGNGVHIPPNLMIGELESLLRLRVATKRKEQIEARGIQVQVMHPSGKNPFDPTNHGGSPEGGVAEIEGILLNRFLTKLPERFREDRQRQERLERERAERAARGEEEPIYG